jgi:hypothetical protein
MKKLTLAALALLCCAVLTARAETIVGVTDDNRLLLFDSESPGTVAKIIPVFGLDAGDNLVGIDFRPANGALYGLGRSGRGYLIDISTGEAFPGTGIVTLNGTSFGVDFNPVPDRVRVTSDANQNLRVNPNDGTLTANDGTLAYAAGDVNAGANPNIVGSAYVNNFATAGATTLYNIDSALDILVIQNPPNAGTLNTIGSLGVNTSDAVGFDVSGSTGTAYASLTVGGIAQLYTINLANGAATQRGPIANPTALGTSRVIGISALTSTATRLRNLSTRGRVGLGEDVLIGGIITRGGEPTTLLARAIGPSLAQKGVTSPLMDPVIEVFDGNGQLIGFNDDWRQSAQAAQITASGLAPTDDRESAVFGTIAPGEYTVIVRGKGDATGVALVEIYNLDD